VQYDDIGYQNLQYVKNPSREDLMQEALVLWKNGEVGDEHHRTVSGVALILVLQLGAIKIAINRRRALSGCKTGAVGIALNGRINRRVACVLDSTGSTVESFDLEGDAEDVEFADG